MAVTAGGDGEDGDDPFSQFSAELRRRRRAAGLSQDRLAVRVDSDQATVSKAERGRKVPPRTFVERTDAALAAGGALVELFDQMRQARRDRTTAAARGQEDDTDRRTFVGGLAAAAVTAAEVSRRVANGDPDPLTLDELEAEMDAVAAAYTTVAHGVIEPRIVNGWRHVEAALGARTRLAVRPRLTLLAGQFAYYLGRLGFNTGDDRSARTFSVLAGQYADDVGDPLLVGSVAGLRSSIAYYAGHYAKAADIAARARPAAHPYSRARLAAYEARAQAAAGRPDDARAALAVMQAEMHTSAPLPGSSPFDDATAYLFAAIALDRLGDGLAAEPDAERAAVTCAAEDRFEDYGHAMLTRASALVRRPHPDPDGAASVTRAVVETTASRPTRTVIQAAEQVAHGLASRWGTLPAVRDLAELTAVARRALPAGTSP